MSDGPFLKRLAHLLAQHVLNWTREIHGKQSFWLWKGMQRKNAATASKRSGGTSALLSKRANNLVRQLTAPTRSFSSQSKMYSFMKHCLARAA